MIFKRKKEAVDDVILINENEIRILEVTALDENSVHAGNLVLPRADAQVRYYPGGGRAFIYGYTGPYLAESQNIADLEKSVVLKNMFNYGSASKLQNIQFYVMLAALIITIFLLRN
ncbi:hypothetical protein [Desulfofundulus salinus]|uniref:Uncharacterized protein n=1 Tax=Desulfofundulus salinus TaxID=2419843 RepID=A0A494X1Z4_9FIRM|nr:hypothetical protein [Desulfofundulus salinum]RKO67165.1 hypothetical protein D7024_09520 [Desulfofundulus salinum]